MKNVLTFILFCVIGITIWETGKYIQKHGLAKSFDKVMEVERLRHKARIAVFEKK